jgi:hypothetical protein
MYFIFHASQAARGVAEEPAVHGPAVDPVALGHIGDGGSAQQANELTPWRNDNHLYGLIFRPLLPDESGCELTADPVGY